MPVGERPGPFGTASILAEEPVLGRGPEPVVHNPVVEEQDSSPVVRSQPEPERVEPQPVGSTGCWAEGQRWWLGLNTRLQARCSQNWVVGGLCLGVRCLLKL